MDNQRITLLHVTRVEDLGIRVFLRGLLAYTDQEKFSLYVASPLVGPLKEDLERMGIPRIRCQLEREIRPVADLRSFFRILTIIREIKPHVLHLHGAKAGFLGRLAGKLARVPLIVYTPNNDYLDVPMPKWRRSLLLKLEQLAAHFGDCIVAVTEEERQAWIRRGICHESRVVAIHDGFDLARATPRNSKEAAKSVLGIPQEYRVVGMIARLVVQKAPHIFLEAAAIVLREMPNVYFLLVGDGPLRSEAEKLIHKLDLESRVLLTGHLSNLSHVYSAMDVSVLTSLYEGLSMAVLESMYLQIPVIVTRTFGATEVVNDGCGMVVPLLDPEAVASALLTILRDEELAKKMGQKARERIEADFSARAMAAKYCSLYTRSVALDARTKGFKTS